MKRVNSMLKELSIKYCPELELPLSEDAEHHYKVLQKLEIAGCDSLKSFPLGFFPKLRSLYINECRNFESLSVIDGIQNLTSLQSLYISNCPNMVSFAEGGLPARNLTKIHIHACKKLKKLPEDMCTLFPFLETLLITEVLELESRLFEDSAHHYKFLQRLTIVGCNSLNFIPLNLFPKLCHLDIRYCRKFESLSGPHTFQYLTSLQSLDIQDCPNIVSIADGGLPAPNLSRIVLWSCEKLKALPGRMCSLLPSLEWLDMYDLPEIESFSSGGLPFSLNSLFVRDCDKLMARSKEWGLQSLPSLRLCHVRGKFESFPDECLLPTSLNRLDIEDCPNLKSLNPNGLRHLHSLETLSIKCCPKLESLPEGLPSFLMRLIIQACPFLNVCCKRGKGKDWPKISHIPYIKLDSLFISSGDQILLI